ncbi:tagatose-6-phosphate kinase [Staphylococcus simulans]|uniref:1-phosphofructokinase family hexose kinase n=1 Tax=Staphylococcus simulans TaxID=1286 RepID=UPI000D1DBD9E|nr:1-phosphofructokinase family hexose kinase [Staphylococcus simulans]PTJ05620.1 tagatose-6-phosphate kinase [Staphylococcus simulans]
MTFKLLTVTLNPAIDINYPLEHFEINSVQRATEDYKSAGGKGINVARVASELGIDVTCTGIIGGKFGEWLTNNLDETKIQHDFTVSPASTRLCIAVTSENSQTEILESGALQPEEIQIRFLEHFNSIISNFDLITISGSLPKGFPEDYYVKLLEVANEQNVPVCLDTSGQVLNYTVNHSKHCPPLLIKPNDEEIKAITNSDNIDLANQLLDESLAHIPYILLSLGKNGALLHHEAQVYNVDIPKVVAINPVGSGDSSLAGFSYGISKDASIQESATYAMAAGISNALEARTGHIDLNNFEKFSNQITIEKVEHSS